MIEKAAFCCQAHLVMQHYVIRMCMRSSFSQVHGFVVYMETIFKNVHFETHFVSGNQNPIFMLTNGQNAYNYLCF